jgi:riboflavin biosynthesis pyrimidine reductase
LAAAYGTLVAMDAPRIVWQPNTEQRDAGTPDPARDSPIGFPPPWPERPWVFGVMVASQDGVVAWRRRGPDDDPVLGVLGGDPSRPERLADKRLMRVLRCYGDVGIGAQTLREQPDLVQLPQEPGEPPAPELYEFRRQRGLQRQPRIVVYSLFGRLPLGNKLFRTPGVQVIVITSERGADELVRRGDTGLTKIVEPVSNVEALRRAHERLGREQGVRYLACEGGMTVLMALRSAGVLDEVFLTTTDARVDAAAHDGVLRIFDFAREGARLVAEGRTAPSSAWRFQRWRFNER